MYYSRWDGRLQLIYHAGLAQEHFGVSILGGLQGCTPRQRSAISTRRLASQCRQKEAENGNGPPQ